MKKTIIFSKLKEKGILTDTFKLSYVEFNSDNQSEDMRLIGYYKSYSSTPCSYSAYSYYFVADKDLENIVLLPYSENSSTGYAHDIPVYKEVSDIDVSEAITNVNFEIKYIIYVSKDADCQKYPFYRAIIYNKIDSVIKKWKQKIETIMNEDF